MILDILRQGKIQSFEYTPKTELDTVASALTALNAKEPLRDIDGNAASPIGWECGCLQKKCGACAVVVNGTPCLACGTRLNNYSKRLRIEPLKKFPLTRDLIVDRGAMLEGLKELNMWLENDAELTDKKQDICFEASRCLQCGCCLEVCPNFKCGGNFKGMAAAVPMARLLLNA
ncbi:MAG: succinate dehydrogenase, partial [Clostridia bacterium]|nr:succinate dehydrogenase [Clostridia bacterium]